MNTKLTYVLLWFFAGLYMVDAWLSIQFMQYDINIEANPFIRWLVDQVGNISVALYGFKAFTLAIAMPMLLYATPRRPRLMATVSTALVILMLAVNSVSYIIVQEIYHG